MLRRLSLLIASLLVLIPADALARAGGGSHSFRAPSSGGSRGTGRGFGGGHFFFFGGGGGGFLLLIVIVVVVLFVISRSSRRRRS